MNKRLWRAIGAGCLGCLAVLGIVAFILWTFIERGVVFTCGDMVVLSIPVISAGILAGIATYVWQGFPKQCE